MWKNKIFKKIKLKKNQDNQNKTLSHILNKANAKGLNQEKKIEGPK
jgi:hypothetical protein